MAPSVADPDHPPPVCPLCGGATAAAAAGRVSLKRKAPADGAGSAVARVEISDEAAALREALARQQYAIGELQAELEAERGAAAGAASEAMSMILRLQREKAEAMMDARQFRRYAEEKMSHDAAEIAALEDLLAKRDASLRSLSSILHSYKSRLLHLGFLSPSSLPSSPTATTNDPFPDYPPLRCIDHPTASEADTLDVETPRDHFNKLSQRIHLLERMPSRAADKGVITCASPRRLRHLRTLSDDSFASGLDFRYGIADEFPLVVDRAASDRDDMSDRVYTIDAVHGVPVAAPEDYLGTPRGSEMCGGASWIEEEEIRKLSTRLQALEADRESMRQAIISMGAEKAQVVLLKEIAQQLCKEADPLPMATAVAAAPPLPVVVPQRKVVKREPFLGKFFVVTVVKWITSVVCWRRKSSRIRYPIGLCGSSVGLLLLLDRFPKMRHQRFLTRN